MNDIKIRASRLSKSMNDRLTYPIEYCENFIEEWEQVTDQLKRKSKNAWRFEKSNKESDLVSDFDNFDVRR